MGRSILLLDIGAGALPNTTPPVAIGASWVPAVYTPPAVPVPGAFAATPSLHAVVLTWNAIGDAAAMYTVERALDVAGAPGAWTVLIRTQDATYTAAAANGTTYWYRIKAVVFGRSSAYAAQLKVTPYTIAGSGYNLVPDQYSYFEAATLPPGLSGGNATLSMAAGFGMVSPNSLRITAQNATTYSYSEPPLAAKFPRTSGKRYIVSAWVLCGVAIPAGDVQMYLRGKPSDVAVAVAANPGEALPPHVWNRVSAIVDASALGDVHLTAFVLFNNIVVGRDYYVDGLMVEELVGAEVDTPSTYTRGTAGGLAMSALVAAQNAQATADGIVDFYFGSTAPAIGGSGAKLGDYWQDADDGKWYRCNGSSWVESTDNRLPQAIVDAAAANAAATNAQTTANSKIRLFILPSTTPPTGPFTASDQWYVSDLKVARYWNGSGWSLLADQTAAMINTIPVNANFDAGFSNWDNQGFWGPEATSGINNGPRAGIYGDTGGTAYRLINLTRIPVKAGGKLGVYAYVARNQVAADGNLWLGAFFYTGDGSWNGNADALVAHAEAGPGWTLIRKYVDIPAGTTHAVFNVMAAPGAGGAWAVDNINMKQIADKSESTAGVGKNLIPNSNFGGENGGTYPWIQGWNPVGAAVSFRGQRDTWVFNSAPYKPPAGVGGRRAEFHQQGTGVGSPAVTDWSSAHRMRVKPNQRYEMYVWAAPYRCSLWFTVAWYDANGNYISEAGTASTPDGYGGGELPGKGMQLGGFVTAPANAAFANVFFRKSNTTSGADSVVFIEQPFFGEALPNQVEFSDYVDGPMWSADELSHGTTSSVVSNDDIHAVGVARRIGLRVKGSRQILGGARNTRASIVAGFSAVRTATALTANSSGQVTVNAHSVEVSGETVTYAAVTNAITGLSQGVTYVVYTLDPFLDGGTRTYFAQTSVLSAQQAGEGAVFIGNVTIPTSGSSSGGGGGDGNPNDWCVAIDMRLPDARYAFEVIEGDFIECWDEQDAPGVDWLAVESNQLVDLIECIRIETTSGAAVVASVSTPMTLRDHRIVYMPDMFGEEALVKRPGQPLAWERVVKLERVGRRTVAKIKVHQRCYFAGEDADATIATHNPNQKP